MASGIGALVVRLGLDAAEYIAGLTKAELVAKKFADNQKRNSAAIDKQVQALQQQSSILGKSAREVKLLELAQKGASEEQLRAANAALRTVEAHNLAAEAGRKLGLAAAAAAAGVALLVGKSINAADNLNDLAKVQGVAATTLGGIGFAAEQAGGSLESASAAIGKLNKSLASAAAGNKEAADTFSLIGVRIKDIAGNTRPVEEVLIDLADRFQTFEDSPERAALAIKLFGRAGADLIPLLLEGGDALRTNIGYYKQYSGVTEDLIKQSDAFNDSLAKVKLLTGAVGNAMALELLPSLRSVADELVRFSESGSAAEAIAKGLASVLRIGASAATILGAAFNSLGKSVAASAVIMGELFSGNVKNAMALATDRAAEINGEFKQTLALLTAINNTTPPSTSGSSAGNQSDAETARLRRSGTPAGTRRAPRIPDGGAASSAQAEFKKGLDLQIRAINDFANQQRDAYEFANRYVEGAYNAGLISQRAYFDEQRRIRSEALAVSVDAINQEIALQQKASQKLTGTDRLDAEGKIAEAVARRAEVTRKFGQDEILANQRNAAAVDALRQRYDDLRATILEMSGNRGGAAQMRIDSQVEDAARTVGAAGGDSSLVSQYRKQLEGLEALRQAQESYARLLEQSRNAEETIALNAQAAGTAELDVLRAIRSARMESLTQLDTLAAKARELAAVLGTPEAAQFADNLTLALKRATVEVDPLLTKLKELSTDLGTSLAEGLAGGVTQGKNLREVLNGIGSDIARVVTNQVFTKPLGNFLSKTIEGSLGGSGGGFLGGIGSAIGKFLGFADGGRPPVGVPSFIGERGKELWVPDQPGTIVPNHALSALGGSRYQITINPPAGMNRATSNQFAADVVRQLQIADGRNN